MEERENVGLLQTYGLHPLVGFGMATIDTMVSSLEAATIGVALFITVPVGLTLGIASILIQKNSFGDDWGLAIGKGLLVGLLTAIPTPLPSAVTLSGGAIGAMELVRRKRSTKSLPAPNERPLLQE